MTGIDSHVQQKGVCVRSIRKRLNHLLTHEHDTRRTLAVARRFDIREFPVRDTIDRIYLRMLRVI
jgi:hypothetical protein